MSPTDDDRPRSPFGVAAEEIERAQVERGTFAEVERRFRADLARLVEQLPSTLRRLFR